MPFDLSFEDDSAAIAMLELAGYTFTRGGLIVPPSEAYIPTASDIAAINYLVSEWDYATE